MKSPLKRSIGEVVTDYGARVMKVFKKGLLQRSLFDFYGDVKADKLRVKESSSVPATPVDKDGGVIYIKSSDGKLYYKSNEVAEVELSATSATTFVMEDGDGTEVTLSQGKEIKFVEGTGIDIDFTDVSTGSDADPYDITISSDLEGTEVKSTGESGGSKFLREDGDGTCSWQTPTDTNTTYSEATGSAEGLMSIAHHDKLDGIESGATADQTQADINGLAITTVGTIDSGTWQGTAIASAYLDSDTAHLSTTQTFTGEKTFERKIILDGDKSVTAGADGVALHIDSQDITDTSTSGSGTANFFNQIVIENPRLMATNSSVTTTNASTVYIKGAPVASTNQTITNAYALYVAAGNMYLGGDLTVAGADISGATNGPLRLSADTDMVFKIDADNDGTNTFQFVNHVGGVLVEINESGDLTLDSVTISAVQTSAESFADNDTSIMTSAAIDDRINAASGGVTADPFNSTTIKILPNQWVINDDAGRPLFVEDDTSNTLGVRCFTTTDEMYAWQKIPSGYKVTDVQVHASASTSSAVSIRSYNYQTGADNAITATTADLNEAKSITNIPASATQDLVIKVSPGSGSTIIYGATVTIATI
jgi:hypothetical protein